MGTNYFSYKIENSCPDHADEICNLLIASIVELCASDHNNDEHDISDWLQNKTPENIKSWILKDNYALSAFHDDKIVGFILMSPKGVILLNYVLPSYAGKGVGTALLKNIEKKS